LFQSALDKGEQLQSVLIFSRQGRLAGFIPAIAKGTGVYGNILCQNASSFEKMKLEEKTVYLTCVIKTSGRVAL
jgi:hypothetical protein